MVPSLTKSASSVSSVIFLDVDGILNILVRDSGHSMRINKTNIKTAWNMMYSGAPQSHKECAQKILAITERTECSLGVGEGCGSTLAALVANEGGLSDILVDRLAELIESTFPHPEVVLTTSLRHTRYKERMEVLRSKIEQKIGEEFHWAGTILAQEAETPEDRLRSIASYMEQMNVDDEVRVLVLDDFFVTPFGRWSCDGHAMKAPEDAERYLEMRCPAAVVKVVHPYVELKTEKNLRVQAAVGLTDRHFLAAANFLLGLDVPQEIYRVTSRHSILMKAQPVCVSL